MNKNSEIPEIPTTSDVARNVFFGAAAGAVVMSIVAVTRYNLEADDTKPSATSLIQTEPPTAKSSALRTEMHALFDPHKRANVGSIDLRLPAMLGDFGRIKLKPKQFDDKKTNIYLVLNSNSIDSKTQQETVKIGHVLFELGVKQQFVNHKEHLEPIFHNQYVQSLDKHPLVELRKYRGTGTIDSPVMALEGIYREKLATIGVKLDDSAALSQFTQGLEKSEKDTMIVIDQKYLDDLQVLDNKCNLFVLQPSSLEID